MSLRQVHATPIGLGDGTQRDVSDLGWCVMHPTKRDAKTHDRPTKTIGAPVHPQKLTLLQIKDK
jgi:hypothetical protein